MANRVYNPKFTNWNSKYCLIWKFYKNDKVMFQIRMQLGATIYLLHSWKAR